MRMLAGLLSVLAAPVAAEQVSCAFQIDCAASTGCPPLVVDFAIDHNQFAPPIDPNEPPRTKVTRVAAGTDSFAAEPIVMGDLRGFWAKAEGVSHLLTVQTDGSAKYSRVPEGAPVGDGLTGQCEVIS